MAVYLIGYLMLAVICGGYADTRLSVLQERMGLLEKRLAEDISILRKEFFSEIGILTDTDNVSASPDDDDKVDDKITAEIATLFEQTSSQLFRQIKVLNEGFQREKVFRRDLEQQIKNEKLKTNDIVRVLSVIGSNITDRLDDMMLQDLIIHIEDIKHILDQMSVVCGNKGESRAIDCSEILRQGHVTSGIYEIYPDTLWRPLNVYCDMTTDGGGWTIFQRRCDGSEDFYRTWNEYRFGFGNLSTEFWLGNEYLYRIMQQAPQEMRIELEDFENDRRFAKYDLFEISSATDSFRIHVEDFSGNVTDSLIGTHNDMQFSTHDKGPSSGCSKSYKGGFWYNKCHGVNVNGLYLKGEHKSYADGVNWSKFRGHHYSLKFTEMKFRSK